MKGLLLPLFSSVHLVLFNHTFGPVSSVTLIPTLISTNTIGLSKVEFWSLITVVIIILLGVLFVVAFNVVVVCRRWSEWTSIWNANFEMFLQFAHWVKINCLERQKGFLYCHWGEFQDSSEPVTPNRLKWFYFWHASTYCRHTFGATPVYASFAAIYFASC